MRRFILFGEFLLLTKIVFGTYLWQQSSDIRALSLAYSLLGNSERNPDIMDNPAINLRTKSFYFSGANLDNDVQKQIFSYRHTFKNYSFGLGAAYFTVGEIPSYDRNKNYLGKTSANEYLIAANFGYDKILLNGDFWINLGLNLKYFSSTLDQYRASSFLLNPGLIIANESNYPFAALAIDYPLARIKYYQTEEDLPATIKLSAGFLSPPWEENLNIESGIVFQQRDKISYFLSAEYKIFHIIFARLGINLFSYPTLNSPFSYGIGIKLTDNFSVDYCFRQQENFASQHFVGLLIKLGKTERQDYAPKTNHFELGKKLFMEGRYAESILELNQALEENPNKSEILELMRQAAEKIK